MIQNIDRKCMMDKEGTEHSLTVAAAGLRKPSCNLEKGGLSGQMN